MRTLKIGQCFNYNNNLTIEEKIAASKRKPQRLIESALHYLTQYGFYGTVDAIWSMLCGCNQCPCSPGWDLIWRVPEISGMQKFASDFKQLFKHPNQRFWFFDEGTGIRIILPYHSAKDAKHAFISYNNEYTPELVGMTKNQKMLSSNKGNPSTDLAILRKNTLFNK